MESLRGRLLIAGANLWDPTFRRAVVLVAHHDDEGAVGIVLNRVAPVTVAEAVPVLAELVPPGERLLLGGPVQPSAAVVVADLEDPSRADIVAFDSVGLLPPETDRDEMGGIRRARVYAGFAGWGPGQLDAELGDDSWAVEPANADDVFVPDPDRLWDRVQSRRGREGALLRLMPMDPSTN
jgi:putative transcriptional regulator